MATFTFLTAVAALAVATLTARALVTRGEGVPPLPSEH